MFAMARIPQFIWEKIKLVIPYSQQTPRQLRFLNVPCYRHCRAPSITSKDVHSPRRQQYDNRERNDGLKHHQSFGPARQNLRIRWRQCRARVEREEEIVNKMGMPRVGLGGRIRVKSHL